MKNILLLLGCLVVPFINQVDGSALAILKRFGYSEGICRLQQKNEFCFSSVETWYFESNGTSGCFNATDKNCGGKGNRFQSKEQCDQKCLEHSERNYEARAYNGHDHHNHHCWDHCENRCPGGYQRCQSCACQPQHPVQPHPIVCNPVHCPGQCVPELVRGENGCTSCQCKKNCNNHECDRSLENCNRVHCPTVCPRPIYSHLQHCCSCRGSGTISRSHCSTHCPNQCHHGHIEHPYGGCRTCDCRVPPHHQPPSESLIDCSHVPCSRDCSFGCHVNQPNCDTRTCLPSPIIQSGGPSYRQIGGSWYRQSRGPPYGQSGGPPYGQSGGPPYGQSGGPPYGQSGHNCPNIRETCGFHCPNGYLLDNRGCEVCQCIDNRNHVCPDAERCGLHCRNGYYKFKGQDGCDVCVCRKLSEDQFDNNHDRGYRPY